MKRTASILLMALLLGVTAYLAYAYGNQKGREEVMEDYDRQRIFPDMYGTLIEEHSALADSCLDALEIVDQYDSFIVAMGKNDIVEMGRHLSNIHQIRQRKEN